MATAAILRAGSASAAESPVSSSIQQVTVYLSGALVGRTAPVSVDAGTSELVFDGLSPHIDPQSIMARGRGTFTILSVDFRQEYLGPDRKPREIKLLEDSLDALNLSMGRLANRQSVLNDEQSMLLANKSVGGSQTGVTAAELARVADYLRSRLGDIREKLLTASVEEKELKERIEKVKGQLAALNARSSGPAGRVTVRVTAEKKATGTLELSYIVRQASWKPYYDIRSDGNGPVQLSYRARVTQQSGEDWDKVKLVLSTGNPALPGTRPELYPWYLDILQPVLLKGNKGVYSQDITAVPRAEAMDEVMAGEAASYVSVEQSRLNTEFAIQIPFSVPSDGQGHAVTIRQHDVPATYSFAVAPKLEESAFMLAALTGWSDMGLLPGPASVYFEGSYTGKSMLNPSTSDDTLRFSFGRDRRIVVKREAVREFTSARIFGSQRQKEFAFDITVKNSRGDTVRILVEDQVPVSRNKDIEVKPDELDGGILDPATGRVTWMIELAPGATAKRRIAFTVKYPKDKPVGGL